MFDYHTIYLLFLNYKMKNMAKTIILTVDGGGVKGVLPSYFLKQLESDLQKSCYQIFDIIGGTSTGGIIATALTTAPTTGVPMTAENIFGMYMNDGNQIFVPQTLAADYWAAYYSDDGSGNGIEPYLQKKYRNTTLSEAKVNMHKLQGARTRHVFTTSYTINSTGGTIQNPQLGQDFGPYLFNWHDAPSPAVDNPNYYPDDYKVWEAARATSAAPTYFPVANVGGGNGLKSSAKERWVLDGGVMSNNPTVWAISEAFRTGLATSLSDIIIISLGTGSYPAGAGLVTSHQGLPDPDNGNWGSTPWMLSNLDDLAGIRNNRAAIINIITESVQLVSNQQLVGLTSSGLLYYRLEPVITQEQTKMDDISKINIHSLRETAVAYLSTGGDGYNIYQEILAVIRSNS